MQRLLLMRVFRTGMLFSFLFLVVNNSMAQYISRIEITINNFNYDCATGQLTVIYRIHNIDQFYTSNLQTRYGTTTGTQTSGPFYASEAMEIRVWQGPFTPGQTFRIWAEGYYNNSSPYTVYDFTPTVSLPAAPVITNQGASALCNGQSTTLTASGGDGIYIWSNGVSSQPGISVTTPGTYTVRVSGTCGMSAPSNPIVITTANVPAAPVIGSSNGTLLCNGQSTTLSSTSSGGTINWSNGNTGTSFTTSSPNTYYASETNGCGTSGNSNVITITTGNAPSAPIISSSNGSLLCNGTSTTLTATATAGGTIAWNTGETGNSITVSSPGSYYAYESTSCGTSGISNTITITAGGTPAAPSVSSSNGTLLCNGQSTILSASGDGAITWNTGATGSSITVNSAGTYYATASNSCGTSAASNAIIISTNSTPAAPSVSSSNGMLLCNGSSTTLSASPSYGGTIHWNTGATGNTLTVFAAGNYYAYEMNSCATGSNSSVISIATASTPAAPAVTPPGNQTLCNGESIILSSSGSNVRWSTGATGNSITTAAAGSYYSYDQNACGSSPNSNVVVLTTVVCPTPLPGSSFFVCPGALKTLDAGAGYDTYEWSTGATTRTIAVGPGTYTVRVSKTGCFAMSAPVTVGYYTVTTPVITASGPTTFCAGGSVVLSASNGASYTWNTGANTSSIHVNTNGSFYVTVTDANGCSATSAALGVTVNSLPAATISGSASICQNATTPSVTFTGSNGTAPYTFVYKINVGAEQTIATTGSNSSVSVSVPTTAPGNFTYSLVSVREGGSLSCSNTASGSATITINTLPTASLAGNTTVCRNSASPVITFSASGGNAPYTFVYRINGGNTQAVTTTSSNSVGVSVPADASGTFVYTLVSVQEASGCSNAASGAATVVVNPLPDAAVSGTATVCQGAASPMISFTGSGGVAPYTFTYKLNNGADQTIATVSGNSVLLSVPTTTAGEFTYTLVSVKESSGTACVSAAGGSVAVKVNALPTATIAGNATLCRNAASPAITFTGNGGITPYTFSYKINNGELQSITTNGANASATVQVPTDAAGNLVYTLVGVQDASSTACSNVVNGSVVVTINPLPRATISGNVTVCQNAGSPVITFAGENGATPYTFTYRIGNGSPQTVTTVSGNTATVSVPTNVSGSFTYTLISVQDGSFTTCSNASSGTVTAIIHPQPAKVIISINNAHLCNDETGTLRVNNYQAGLSYTWYRNGITFRTVLTDTIKITEAGVYTVIAVSTEGCASPTMSDPVTISVGSVTTPVITGSLKVCPDGKTKLLASVTDPTSIERWRWTRLPDKHILSEDSSFFVGAGQYRVRIEREGCADSVHITVSNDDTEFPAGALKLNKSSIAYGEPVELFADVTGAVRYMWDIGNGRPFPTESNRIMQSYFVNSDSMPVKVWAISERNCISVFAGSLKIGAMAITKLPDNSYTGRVKDWNVFPIPFRDQLKITAVLQKNEAVRIDLFTADGRWIKSYSLNGIKGDNLFTLDVTDLKPNILYHIVGTYNGQKHTDKIYKH